MSQWNKAQHLPHDELELIYGNAFPIEARKHLAFLIEEIMQRFPIVIGEPKNAQYEEAPVFLNRMIGELRIKASMMDENDPYHTKEKLGKAAAIIENLYGDNPFSIIGVLRECLAKEQQLIQQYENMKNLNGLLFNANGGSDININQNQNINATLNYHQNNNLNPQVHAASTNVEEDMAVTNQMNNLDALLINGSGGRDLKINQEIGLLNDQTRNTEDHINQLKSDQETFALNYNESQKINVSLNYYETQGFNSQIQTTLESKKIEAAKVVSEQAIAIINSRKSLQEKLSSTIDQLAQLQHIILEEELQNWKQEQRMARNGLPVCGGKLDKIQEWCEHLADIIWRIRFQISEFQRYVSEIGFNSQGYVDILSNLSERIYVLLDSLVKSTFIIEKEPPQVMKTNTHFTATVRLLVGGALKVYMTPPQIRVSILSEAKARSFLQSVSNRTNDTSGDILNNTGPMAYTQKNRQLAVTFRKMQLKNIKRAERNGVGLVMDEKFVLLFQSQFSIGGGKFVFKVWELSLPVVVTVHCIQEPAAWATISWDNAFAEQGRVPFQVPTQVFWPQVAEMLNMKFMSQTGRGLTDENLSFLATKALRTNELGDLNQMSLTWLQFCKDPLPDRDFTFWDWFYASMKVIKDHACEPWKKGSISGFISRNRAEDLLMNTFSGTFLLRFSDSTIGGISVAWLKSTGDHKEILMIKPFTGKDLSFLPLEKRLHDLRFLQYVYPKIPKEEAFKVIYQPATPVNVNRSTGGYLETHVVCEVVGYDTSDHAKSRTSSESNSSNTAPTSPFSPVSACQSGEQSPQIDLAEMWETIAEYEDFNLPDLMNIDVNQIIQNGSLQQNGNDTEMENMQGQEPIIDQHTLEK